MSPGRIATLSFVPHRCHFIVSLMRGPITWATRVSFASCLAIVIDVYFSSNVKWFLAKKKKNRVNSNLNTFQSSIQPIRPTPPIRLWNLEENYGSVLKRGLMISVVRLSFAMDERKGNHRRNALGFRLNHIWLRRVDVGWWLAEWNGCESFGNGDMRWPSPHSPILWINSDQKAQNGRKLQSKWIGPTKAQQRIWRWRDATNTKQKKEKRRKIRWRKRKCSFLIRCRAFAFLEMP